MEQEIEIMQSTYFKGLSLILVFGLTACGNAMDGRWAVDKEATTASCLKAIDSKTADPNGEVGVNGALQEMMGGFMQKMCEGVASNLAPQVDIDGPRMLITTAIGESEQKECSINLDTNEFDCANAKVGGGSGLLKIVEGNLIWELPPQPEKPSFSFTYNRVQD